MTNLFHRNDATFSQVAYSDLTGAPSGGNGFRADLNSVDLGFADATFTKVTVTNEVFDTGSTYDAPNSKWTPASGRVLVGVNGSFTFGSGTINAGNLAGIAIYKNGVLYVFYTLYEPVANAIMTISGSFLDNANGTDYYEMYAYCDTTTGTPVLSGAAFNTFFWGAQL